MDIFNLFRDEEKPWENKSMQSLDTKAMNETSLRFEIKIQYTDLNNTVLITRDWFVVGNKVQCRTYWVV